MDDGRIVMEDGEPRMRSMSLVPIQLHCQYQRAGERRGGRSVVEVLVSPFIVCLKRATVQRGV